MHFYSEHNAYRAAVLRERIADGLLPQGVVDERDIEIIPDEDFLGYEQVHLFAGIGGFPLGMRRAGFPEHICIVDGGFPCQDISNAGKRAGITGSRSRLWREMVRCIRVVRPQLVFVENVAALLCRGMGDVLGDLAEIGYDATGDCISAADVGAHHLRRRIWIVAHDARARSRRISVFAREPRQTDADANGRGEIVADATERGQPMCWESSRENGFPERSSETVANSSGSGFEIRSTIQTRQPAVKSSSEVVADAEEHAERPGLCTGESRWQRRGRSGNGSRWPVEPNVGRVAHGIPKRVDRLAALGASKKSFAVSSPK